VSAEPQQEVAPATGMRARVLGGLAWTGGSQVVGQVARLVAAIALARLLSPHDYGLAALALVYASLVLVFSDMALGAAVVQRKNLTEDDRCTAFWMSITAGVAFTLIGAGLSGVVAAFYGEPEAAALCAVLSLSFIITSLATTHEALLLRDMRYAPLEQRVMIATIVGAATGIVVALYTRDAWAIIAQQLAHATTSTILLWLLSDWRPKLRVSGESLRALGSFSGYLVGHRLLWYAHRNADNVLIGRFLGASALGAYTLAYNIMLVPMSRIAGPVQKVLGPAFAKMQDEPARMVDAWVRAVRLVGSISVPALAGLIVVAPDFVTVVLGSKWSAAAPIIQVLAWVGILQSLQSITTDVLQARGKTRTIFRFTLCFTAAHVAAFAIGLEWGVVGVAAGYAISSTLVEPVYLWLATREVGTTPFHLLGALRGIFEASALMAALALATRHALIALDVPAFPRLVLVSLVGAGIFLAAWRRRAPEAWEDAAGILRPALGRIARLRRRAPATGLAGGSQAA
jgi:O-antigen/teichoic acid export membrane protein